ncbi:adhesin [Haemophilus influenzae]|nr:hypothetical protein [Haemophilus influenzae]EEW76194.1 autotransporter adhesin [Haemophilus influenzae RdAW]MCK9045537.1 adhesin [Haemophilus influenzae]
MENAYKTERQNYADLTELRNILYDFPKKQEEVNGLKANMEQLKTAANPNQAKIDNATKSYETAKNELVSTWKGTAGSVSVGNKIRGITHQITGVAAGTLSRTICCCSWSSL